MKTQKKLKINEEGNEISHGFRDQFGDWMLELSLKSNSTDFVQLKMIRRTSIQFKSTGDRTRQPFIHENNNRRTQRPVVERVARNTVHLFPLKVSSNK